MGRGRLCQTEERHMPRGWGHRGTDGERQWVPVAGAAGGGRAGGEVPGLGPRRQQASQETVPATAGASRTAARKLTCRRFPLELQAGPHASPVLVRAWCLC